MPGHTLPPLSLEEQVGQVIMAVAAGDLEHLAGLVGLGRVGGVLVPPTLAPSPLALAATLNRLQRLASYPLLCAADLAARPESPIPLEAALGAARRPELARRAGVFAAAWARAVGVHLVLGPVLDVHREPARPGDAMRSFGENPLLAAHLGASFVVGCRAGRALAVARHFPGQGGAVYDVAHRLLVVSQDREWLERIDLAPYVEACGAGLGAIMTGHLHVAALDSLPNRLATHSSAVVEGLLRRTLQFRGLLLTASLDAPEVSARYAPGQAAVLAFAAGHDLLVTASPDEVYRALYEVLLHGDVSQARLQEAVARVWAAKAWLGLPAGRFVPAPPSLPARGGELAREVARASLTVVRGRRLVAGTQPLVLGHRGLRADGSAVDDDLRRLAAACLAHDAVHILDAQPTPSHVDDLLLAAAQAEAVYMFLALPPGEGNVAPAAQALMGLVPALKRAGVALAAVAMGDAYALAYMPEVDLLLHLPGDAPPYLEAALAYLLGQTEAPGRLPITVPGLAL